MMPPDAPGEQAERLLMRDRSYDSGWYRQLLEYMYYRELDRLRGCKMPAFRESRSGEQKHQRAHEDKIVKEWERVNYVPEPPSGTSKKFGIKEFTADGLRAHLFGDGGTIVPPNIPPRTDHVAAEDEIVRNSKSDGKVDSGGSWYAIPVGQEKLTAAQEAAVPGSYRTDSGEINWEIPRASSGISTPTTIPSSVPTPTQSPGIAGRRTPNQVMTKALTNKIIVSKSPVNVPNSPSPRKSVTFAPSSSSLRVTGRRTAAQVMTKALAGKILTSMTPQVLKGGGTPALNVCTPSTCPSITNPSATPPLQPVARPTFSASTLTSRPLKSVNSIMRSAFPSAISMVSNAATSQSLTPGGLESYAGSTVQQQQTVYSPPQGQQPYVSSSRYQPQQQQFKDTNPHPYVSSSRYQPRQQSQ